MRKSQLEGFGQRVKARMGEMSIKELGVKIGKSYEMTRRYVNGWALPDDPRTLENLATVLGTSVGYLLADETEVNKLPPVANASDMSGPIREATRMVIEDDAMTIHVENIRLFGIGDQVILYPRKAIPGDVVAVRMRESTTLRKVVETSEGYTYVPRKEDHATYTKCTVIGVVAQVNGRVERFE